MDVIGEAKAVEDDVSAPTETKPSTGRIGNVVSKPATGAAASLRSMGQIASNRGRSEGSAETQNAVRSVSYGRGVSTKGTHEESKRGSVDDSAEPPFRRPSLAPAVKGHTLPANN